MDITLANGSSLPSGMQATFFPAGTKVLPFTSTLNIEGKNVSKGHYILKIIAFGANGMERYCWFILENSEKPHLIDNFK
jgi:hypothetical protein